MFIIRILNMMLIISCEKRAFLDQEKCFHDLGCVVLTSEWTHPVHRPKNLLPADRHIVDTIFIRWKIKDNNSDVTPEILGSENINLPHTAGGVKLFIHDFTSNGYTGWIKHLCKAMLTSPEYVNWNLISVNWAIGAEPPYIQAIANARLVALEVVHFLNKISNLHYQDPNNIHVIGHGVGAHIGGYVGKMVQLRQITALDPSGLYFRHMPPNVRLHKDDAKYVEVIHSDIDGQGYAELLGHVDFYPNGGSKQPGCVDSGKKLTSVKRGDLKVGESVPACSHKRSLKYYIEAMTNPTCSFVGISCNSYKDFLKGKCVSCGDRMQYCARLNPLRNQTKHINNSSGYYFVTSNSAPFCGEQINVVLHLKDEMPKQRYVKGYFRVKIPQKRFGDVKFFLNENHVISLLRANEPHFFVVFRSTPPPLQLPAKLAFVKWIRSPMPCALCVTPDVSYLVIHKISDSSKEAPQSFCPMNKLKKDMKILRLEPCLRPAKGNTISENMKLNETIPLYFDYKS